MNRVNGKWFKFELYRTYAPPLFRRAEPVLKAALANFFVIFFAVLFAVVRLRLTKSAKNASNLT
jgi:hypothetical protein